MKKMEKDCPDSWIFEQDYNKMLHAIYNRKRNKFLIIATCILILLVLTAFFSFAQYYGNAKKAGRIIIGFEIVSTLALYLVIWVLKKRILKKYWPMIIIPIIALLIVIVVINIYTEGNVSLQSADILSFLWRLSCFFRNFLFRVLYL